MYHHKIISTDEKSRIRKRREKSRKEEKDNTGNEKREMQQCEAVLRIRMFLDPDS
jgi:hypothetical protein